MFFLDGLSEAPEPPPEAGNGLGLPEFRRQSAGLLPDASRTRGCAHRSPPISSGEDRESVTDQQSTDVTLELANMICGAVLSRIESNAAFRLGTPQIAADKAGLHEPKEETRFTVETGSGTLTAAIQMETRTCSPTETYAS